ncbi:MAG: hypothetical protein A2Z25_07995 [Planctomycetes bacterium RBG_16_55_9]|nr:MAG: hypothetical protein A2Z25_07995 [Planctomycetes bacterium RBG_16_55_9]
MDDAHSTRSMGGEVTRMSSKAPRYKKGDTVIFTGASGVKPKLAIEKFNDYLKSKNKVPLEVFDFEDRLVGFARENPMCKTSKSFQRALDNQEPIIAVTSLPYPLLRAIWVKAMNSVCDDVTAVVKTGRDVAILMHAVYFNTDSTSLVPIVDTREIERIHPTCVVELIDDVYDIYGWLKGSGGVFNECSYPESKFDQVQRTIQQLVAALVWRQAEAGTSSHIAGLLGGVPHFTIATKHRCRLLEQVLEGNPHRVYLSHPITEARSRAAIGDLDTFYTFCREVESLADHLATELPVWEPTKIDELRLRFTEVEELIQGQERSEKTRLALPRLLPRWLVGCLDKVLWADPQHRMDDETILDPAQLFTKEEVEQVILAKTWKAIEDELGPEKSAQLRSISGQLADLFTVVGQQINTRDRTLVGQCPILVIYRPVFNGKQAIGVQREIEEHQRLVGYQHYGAGSSPAVFVLENSHDERLVWRNAVADLCGPEGQWSKYLRNRDGTSISSERAQEIGQFVTKERVEPDHIVRMMNRASQTVGFAWNDPRRSVLDGGSKGPAWEDFVKKRVRDLQETIRERMSYKEVLSAYTSGTVSVYTDISPIDFADKVKKGLTGAKG